MKKKILNLIIVILATFNFANAQTTEVKISLDEQFFDAMFEAVFTNLGEPSFPVGGIEELKDEKNSAVAKSFAMLFPNASFLGNSFLGNSSNACKEAIFLKKEVEGVKTAVKFRQGKITAPIAFRGNYNPPLVGCIDFQGWAESNIELKFDQNKQALVGYAKVSKVNLSGTGGIGSSLLAGFVQNSIDKKVNPLEIIKMDKLSFLVPVQKAGNLKMKALGIRHVVNEKSLDVYLKYQFMKE